MAKFMMVDAAVRVNGVIRQDLVDEVSVATSVNELDVTCFGSSGYRSRIGGLVESQFAIRGFEDFSNGGSPESVGDEFFANLGGATLVPIEVFPDTTGGSITVGDVAYFSRVIRTSVQVGASVGDPYKFDVSAAGSGAVVRGQAEVASQNVTSGGHTSPGAQLGAVGASQRLWYVVSVESVNSAGTVTCTLESDDNGSFTSATTQATEGVSAVGGTFGSVTGAVSDDYWRWVLTASGGTDLDISITYGVQ